MGVPSDKRMLAANKKRLSKGITMNVGDMVSNNEAHRGKKDSIEVTLIRDTSQDEMGSKDTQDQFTGNQTRSRK